MSYRIYIHDSTPKTMIGTKINPYTPVARRRPLRATSTPCSPRLWGWSPMHPLQRATCPLRGQSPMRLEARHRPCEPVRGPASHLTPLQATYSPYLQLPEIRGQSPSHEGIAQICEGGSLMHYSAKTDAQILVFLKKQEPHTIYFFWNSCSPRKKNNVKLPSPRKIK